MENQDLNNRSKRRSTNTHISISDTESSISLADSWHSPRRSESPHRSDAPSLQPENGTTVHKNIKSVTSFDKYYSPVPSPGKSNSQAISPAAGVNSWTPWTQSEKRSSGNFDFPAIPSTDEGKGDRNRKTASPVILGLDRLVRDDSSPIVQKMGGLEDGYGDRNKDAFGGNRQSTAAVSVTNILRRSERTVALRKATLMFRVLEAIVCLISFSVMAANKTRGWTGDSFDRYKEYRYCLGVNVLGFVYSGFQVYSLAYHLGTGKYVISHYLRYHFDFSMDQILAYLLLSASSSAATRVTDWISNWGKDQFTSMATASIGMSFLGFFGFAFSSLISGYNLYIQDDSA